MKTRYAALASLVFFAIAAPSAKSDTLSNNHITHIFNHMQAAGLSCAYVHVLPMTSDCIKGLKDSGDYIQNATQQNFDLIQNKYAVR